MSVLGDYYRAQIGEASARTSLTGVQTQTAVMQANQLGADGQARRNLEDAQAQAANAGATKTGLEAGQVGADSGARRNLENAQQTLLSNQGQTVLPTAQSEIAQRNASTQGTIANTAGQNIANSFAPLKTVSGLATDALNRQGYAFTTLPSSSLGPSIGNLGGDGTQPKPPLQGDETGGMILSAKDAALGKAKKPGPTDTVPVMLTPGEAVLNKGATEHYGQALIEHMNKMGMLRMGAQTEAAKHLGLPDPHAPPEKGKPAQAKSAGPATPPSGSSKRNGMTGTRKKAA